MKILITGATGFIGKSLVQKLISLGHQIVCVSRDNAKAKAIFPEKQVEFFQCDLVQQVLPQKAFHDVDAVVHLLGESIEGYWTESKKNKIIDSRKLSSKNLVQNMPESVVVVSASAQGIYGDRNDEVLTEDSKPGEGFLAEVCKVWENEFKSLPRSQKKVVIVRIGLVLDPRGGALQKLVGIFSKNLGAPLGSGNQWMSWISLRDLVSVFVRAIEDERLNGVVNAVQPQPIRNKDFTSVLCQHLNVIQLPRVPGWVLKTVLGDMSSLVLQSQRLSSEKLQKIGFAFQDTDLKSFFQVALKSK